MKIWSIQNIFATLIHPFFFRKSLTHRTASVTAGIIMNLRLTAIFAYADIGAVSSGFTVNNAMSNLSLLRRRCIFVQIFWVKTMKYILYSWFSHVEHLPRDQKDFVRPAKLCCLYEDKSRLILENDDLIRFGYILYQLHLPRDVWQSCV